MCPLLIGVEENNIHLVNHCLGCPLTDINVANNEGKTALILAVEIGNIGMLKLLLDKERANRINPEHLDVSKKSVFLFVLIHNDT